MLSFAERQINAGIRVARDDVEKMGINRGETVSKIFKLFYLTLILFPLILIMLGARVCPRFISIRFDF